ncbi:hypothetical protein, partial [Burkholderia cenocepacia]|uniref:hypothetical protein n=1 Tax=Burkholderia cenocepacia TaxID=95486 RepID=UPI002AB1CF45
IRALRLFQEWLAGRGGGFDGGQGQAAHRILRKGSEIIVEAASPPDNARTSAIPVRSSRATRPDVAPPG